MLVGIGVECIPESVRSEFIQFLDSLDVNNRYCDYPIIDLDSFFISDVYIYMLHIRSSGSNIAPLARSRRIKMSDYKDWLRSVLIDKIVV